MANAQYLKTVAISEGLEAEWQAYQRTHPGATFSGTLRALLAQFLREEQGAVCVKITTPRDQAEDIHDLHAIIHILREQRAEITRTEKSPPLTDPPRLTPPKPRTG